MKLEPIIQSEVSQKNKDQYSILTHIYMEFRKMVTITLDVQNRLLDSVGEGEGGMFQENSIETCILYRVKQITSQGGMHETSAWGWCTRKREVGGGIRMGNTCKSIADSCRCMAKTITIL